MRVEATLLRAETKETAVYVEDLVDIAPNGQRPEPEDVLYNWTEGNYGCDCNRVRFFGLAKEETVVLESRPCGDHRYLLLKLVVDGVVLLERPEAW